MFEGINGVRKKEKSNSCFLTLLLAYESAFFKNIKGKNMQVKTNLKAGKHGADDKPGDDRGNHGPNHH